MTPEEIAAQQFQAWVESRVWVFAKTMPEHRHFYTTINRKRTTPKPSPASRTR
jgi:hypothetical protein